MKFNFSPEESRGIIVICIAITSLSIYMAIKRDSDGSAQSIELQEEVMSRDAVDTLRLVPFDPNEVQLAELLGMGITKLEALSILRYRAAGKVFNIKEEVIACYGISDSLYFALEPYIVIGEKYQYRQRSNVQSEERVVASEVVKVELEPFLVDTVGVEYFLSCGVLSRRQAEVFVKWRDMSGVHSMEELRQCYTVSDEVADLLEPYAIFSERREEVESDVESQKRVININTATHAELVSIYGIGDKSADAIVEYRDKLGGFYSKEQLSEINIITESNYEKIITQILVDSCDISKIDVNFASAKDLAGHPYIESKILRRLLKVRQLKGGWSTIEHMIDDDIFSYKEAQRLRPYLQFEMPIDLGTTDRE